MRVSSASLLLLLLLAAVATPLPLPAAEPADWILTARSIVTLDPARRAIDNGAVAVKGDSIVAVGPRAEIERRFRPRHRLARPDSVILPGLVNVHAHAAMALYRGIADDLPLQQWLAQYIFPAEAKNTTADFVRWGTRLACMEMLASGNTTFVDMYYFEEVVAEVAKECGIRGVLGQTIIGFPSPDAKTPADALARAEAFLRRFPNDPLVTPAVAPHAIYSNSDETLRAARELANRYDKPLIIHLSETLRENDESLARRQMSPTRALDALGLFTGGRTIAAHGVWLDDADIEILARRGVGVGHCPSSNMKLASGVAPVAKLVAAGVHVGLGTDGPAGSNNDTILWEEMDLAGKLAKVTSGDPRALPADKLVEMATLGGARALGLDKITGSLEPGKRADLIAVRIDTPHAAPSYNIYSSLVYAMKGSDVTDVMVNGRWVLRSGALLTLNRAAVLAKAAEYRDRIRASLR